MKTNGEEPINSMVDCTNIKDGEVIHVYASIGLTKREYFAAMAMQGLLSNTNVDTKVSPERFAQSCVLSADALITALNNQEK